MKSSFKRYAPLFIYSLFRIQNRMATVNQTHYFADTFLKHAQDSNDARAVPEFDEFQYLKTNLSKYVNEKPTHGIRLNDVNHIGFNQRYSFDTPFGICFYPLNSDIYNQAMSGKLPYNGNYPYMHLFELKGNILYIQDYNNFEQDALKLIKGKNFGSADVEDEDKIEFIDGNSVYDFTPEHAQFSIDRSLKRLRTIT